MLKTERDCERRVYVESRTRVKNGSECDEMAGG